MRCLGCPLPTTDCLDCVDYRDCMDCLDCLGCFVSEYAWGEMSK